MIDLLLSNWGDLPTGVPLVVSYSSDIFRNSPPSDSTLSHVSVSVVNGGEYRVGYCGVWTSFSDSCPGDGRWAVYNGKTMLFALLLYFCSLHLVRIFVCVFECKGNRSVCESPKRWLCSLQPPVKPPEFVSVNEPSVPFLIWIWWCTQTRIQIRICRKKRHHDASQCRVEAGIPYVLVTFNTGESNWNSVQL